MIDLEVKDFAYSENFLDNSYHVLFDVSKEDRKKFLKKGTQCCFKIPQEMLLRNDSTLGIDRSRPYQTFYKMIIDKFGADHQINMFTEESSELTKELCKYRRGANNIDHIIEEIADVEIMLLQLKIIYDCIPQVDSEVFNKYARTYDRFKKGELT